MELTIIILYLLAIFGVGIYCNKFNKGLDDYLVAGRRLGVGLATARSLRPISAAATSSASAARRSPPA